MTEARWSVGAASKTSPERTIPVVALGLSLAVFFVISYIACIALYLVAPTWVANHAMLSLLLPGFELLSWPSFFLGLAESFGYGWYIALVFAPLYNYFVAKAR
jgi:hypothetical protein